jgi:hypothetical protein
MEALGGVYFCANASASVTTTEKDECILLAEQRLPPTIDGLLDTGRDLLVWSKEMKG